jgi:multidrug efflux system membrane fusion protein
MHSSLLPHVTRPTVRRRAIAALSLLAVAAACSKQQPQRGRQAVPVIVAAARKADVPYTVEANGVVTPLQSAAVSSQVDGIIQRVAFREGQDVAKGEVLFEIDPRPYRAAYRQALAALARDRANAANAQREAQRYTTLEQQNYVTREQADQQRANAEATAATAAASEAQVASARFNYENATIRAPISGRTGALLVREGNLVHTGGTTPLVVINQVSPILVRFAIPATQLPLLQKYGTGGGLMVSATPNSDSETVTDTSAHSPIGLSVGGGDPGQSASGGSQSSAAGPRSGAASSQLLAITEPEHGSLYFIDNAVDTTTGTVQLKASFPNPNRHLWAGEFVVTRLQLFVERNALVVPASAVVTGQQGPYVYVVTDSATAQQRPVTVERTAGAITVIASGLRPGEKVVTDGQARLTPNAKVTIDTPQGSAAGRQGGGRRGGAGNVAGNAGGAGRSGGAVPAGGQGVAGAPGAGGPGASRPAGAGAGGPRPTTAAAPTP